MTGRLDFIGKRLVLGPLLLLPIASPAQTEPPPRPKGTPTPEIEFARPGKAPEAEAYVLPPIDPSRVPPPEAFMPGESLAVPDRWRIMETLGVIRQRFKDPYHQNVFKGDKPYPPFRKWGDDLFLNLMGVSDSLVEGRGRASSEPSSDQFGLGQTVVVGASVLKGDTTFRPPDYEYRLILAANLRRTQVGAPSNSVRNHARLTLVEAFYGKHRRNVSERYDFDSYRVGLQALTSDFRGLLFQESGLGVRLFGNRDNNRTQYNLAALVRMARDADTGLIDLLEGPRRDLVLLANVYRQDFPRPGHTTQLGLINNWNAEDGPAHEGKTGAPHGYNVTYLGANGDGHFGPWNLTTSLYGVAGRDSRHPWVGRAQTVLAAFGALELSRDFDWVRGRFTLIGATGDGNPKDGKSTGFDAIAGSPQIAGADSSFWIRQALPLEGGAGVVLSPRNGILPSLRSAETPGQSNFLNPGLLFAGLGADLDLTPQLRVVTNVSGIGFANTSIFPALGRPGVRDRFAGIDTSVALQIRPRMTQNVVLNIGSALLWPGRSFRNLTSEDGAGPRHSFLARVLLTY